MSAGSMRTAAQALDSVVQSLDGAVRSEVYGGGWDDDVGRSYLTYAEDMRRINGKLSAIADNMSNIESTLNSFNEKADSERLAKIKAAVNSL